MTEKTLGRCFSMIKAMPHGSEQQWTDDLRPLYLIVIRNWDDPLAERVMERMILECAWRPAPAVLHKIACEIASPIPDDDRCYLEIMENARLIGIYGDPDPKNGNVFLAGPPPMSHPVVSNIVAYCGGWEAICTGEAGFQEGLKKQVRSAHDSVRTDWYLEVGKQLALPAAQRDSVYFSMYAPYKARLLPEYEFEHVTSEPPLLEASEELVPIPPAIREQIKALTGKE